MWDNEWTRDCVGIDLEPTYRAGHTHAVDFDGNISAHDGSEGDRCVCGCNMWENDHCFACGRSIQRVWVFNHGQSTIAMLRIKHQWAMDALGLEAGTVRDFDENIDRPGSGRMVPTGDGYARIVVDA